MQERLGQSRFSGISRNSYIARRRELMRRVGSGVILLPGNELSPMNYPNNAYRFRQDSTLRYYFGVNRPSLTALIDVESGEDYLFGDDYTLEEVIWCGTQPTIEQLAQEVGVKNALPKSQLKPLIDKTLKQGRKIHTLPAYRAETKLQLSELLDITPHQATQINSPELLFAVAAMREVKSQEEVAAVEDAITIGYQMHTQAMKMCRVGRSEREIAGALEGIACSWGAGVSFNTIATQNGETLHNISQDGVLEDGRMFLLDAGAESLHGYCSDHTRTYPVNGRFTSIQRELYNIVLDVHNHIAQIARPMPYVELHRLSQLRLAQGLLSAGLVEGSAEDIVESGATTLFMPHGLGHGLGMDVHDCENIGERSLDFSHLIEQAKASQTAIYRPSWQLRQGTILTNEPGLYFIPSLIDARRREGAYRGVVRYDKLESLYNFGGIRIEDDILITEDGCRVLGEQSIPKSVEQIEEVMQ
ncbi:MAG: aminopeptidase P family protein [Rikenellaceae bacterium]